LYPVTIVWTDAYKKAHPDVIFDISAGGAGKGFTDALSGMVDLGMFSRELTPVELKKNVWYIAVAADAVFPIVNANHPKINELLKFGFTQTEFATLFLQEKKEFLLDSNITLEPFKAVIYTRSDACGSAQVWSAYLKSNQESLKGIGVYGDPGITEAVKRDKHGFGYNNMVFVFNHDNGKVQDGIKIIPIDVNSNGIIDSDEDFYTSVESINKAINEKKYPTPPSRLLYFVAKGKPDNENVKTFLRWILTDGQQMLTQNGYIPLSDEMVKEQLKKLD